MPQPTNQLSDYEVDERAASATAVLDDPVVKEAIDKLKSKYVDELVSAAIGSPESMSAHAGIKLIGGFQAELQSMITEKRVRTYRKGSTPQ